jgi:hypothetical protein
MNISDGSFNGKEARERMGMQKETSKRRNAAIGKGLERSGVRGLAMWYYYTETICEGKEAER